MSSGTVFVTLYCISSSYVFFAFKLSRLKVEAVVSMAAFYSAATLGSHTISTRHDIPIHHMIHTWDWIVIVLSVNEESNNYLIKLSDKIELGIIPNFPPTFSLLCYCSGAFLLNCFTYTT